MVCAITMNSSKVGKCRMARCSCLLRKKKKSSNKNTHTESHTPWNALSTHDGSNVWFLPSTSVWMVSSAACWKKKNTRDPRGWSSLWSMSPQVWFTIAPIHQCLAFAAFSRGNGKQNLQDGEDKTQGCCDVEEELHVCWYGKSSPTVFVKSGPAVLGVILAYTTTFGRDLQVITTTGEWI